MSNSINKNIWLVMDENDKLKLIHALNESKIPTKYQAKILAGPLSSEELQRRVTQKNLSDNDRKEAQENLNVYRHQTGETHTPIYWGLCKR